MSMLFRYKKPGGFLQLLSLIETCTPDKQEKLLKLIEAEDKEWASLLYLKMLTVEKIFTWDKMIIAEIVSQMPVRTVAVILKSLKPEDMAKATHTMNHTKKRQLDDAIEEVNPNKGEIYAGYIKLIQKVRELTENGTIKLEKIEPALSVEEFKQKAA